MDDNFKFAGITPGDKVNEILVEVGAPSQSSMDSEFGVGGIGSATASGSLVGGTGSGLMNLLNS